MANAKVIAQKLTVLSLLAVAKMRGDVAVVLQQLMGGENPYSKYEGFRKRGPIVRSKFQPVWVTADHKLVTSVLKDLTFLKQVEPASPSTFSERVVAKVVSQGSGEQSQSLGTSPLEGSLLEKDPPDHTRLRKLATEAFTPRAIEKLRARGREIANSLLDRVSEGGSMDLMSDFAAPLPILMICEVLGIPADDVPRFRKWGNVVGASLDGVRTPEAAKEVESAAHELEGYFEELFEQHRSNPGESLLDGLIAAESEGDRLTHKELVSMCILLLIAGFETTVNLIGNGTLALVNNPDQLAKLRNDPSLTRNAVEEFLRYDSPVQGTSRMASRDVELGGTTIRRGEAVITLLGGANRDPKVFPSPDSLDITRSNAGEHVSFAGGIHFCLGAALARLEGQVAFQTLLERCPDLRQAGPETRRNTTLLRGLATFPVEFAPTKVSVS
jgi:cytochrome P450